MKKHYYWVLSVGLMLALGLNSCYEDDEQNTETETQPTIEEETPAQNFTVKLIQDGEEKAFTYTENSVLVLDENFCKASSGTFISGFNIDGKSYDAGSYITVTKDFTINVLTGKYTTKKVEDLDAYLNDCELEGAEANVEISNLSADKLQSLKETIEKYSEVNINLSISESSNITAIPASMFSTLTNITEISLPSTVTVIEDNAFEFCTAVKTVKFKPSRLKKDAQIVTKTRTYNGEDINALLPIDTVIIANEDKAEPVEEIIYAVINAKDSIVTTVMGLKPDYTSADTVAAIITTGSWKKGNGETFKCKNKWSDFNTVKGVFITHPFAVDILKRKFYCFIPHNGTNCAEYLTCKNDAFYNSLGREVMNFSAYNKKSYEAEVAEEPIEHPIEGVIIKAKAFNGCIDLKSITFPDYVGYIGDNAFENTGLEAVVFEGDITLGESVFGTKKGTLKVVQINAKTFSSNQLEYLKGIADKVIYDSDITLY